MMQMPAAGETMPLEDGNRKADGDNPTGYVELESATRIRGDKAWLQDATGSASARQSGWLAETRCRPGKSERRQPDGQVAAVVRGFGRAQVAMAAVDRWVQQVGLLGDDQHAAGSASGGDRRSR
jgi:hypothetical protein